MQQRAEAAEPHPVRGRSMDDEKRFEGGHIDTPLPSDPAAQHRTHSDPIDTPYPEGGIGARPQRPEVPEPRFWRLRQRANPYFMGRETLMIALHNAFQTHPVVHLRGPLGSGTTQTALAYAFRARPNFDGIFWVDGKDPTIARYDLARAGNRLDSSWQESPSLEHRIDAILAWMRTHLRWLLVIDGVESFSTIAGLIPEQPNGRILITGDQPLEGEHHVLEHPVFNHQSACLFLAHRSQQEKDKPVSALVRLFGSATMPIFIAGACCHVAKMSLQDYQKRIKASLAKNDPPHDGTNLEHAMRAVVEQSLQHAATVDPAALELMALCAFFDTEDIALAMLCDGAPFLPKRLGACVSNPGTLNATLTLLHRLGLVQFEQNSLAIHREIQRATRELLGKDQKFAWTMTALRVVREAFPVESRYVPPIPACAMLLRHVFVVTAWSEQSDQLREGTGQLLNHVGLYLHACKELAAARSCFERSIRLAEAFHGPLHPTVAARVNSLGVVLQDMGLYEEARTSYGRAFKICEAVYGPARDAAMGPAHRSMLTMPSRNLCQVLELMGDIPGAKAAYQEAVKVFIDVYCWNHSLVAEAMNGLGELFLKEKNYFVAKQYFEKAIQAEEHADEPELGNLGHFTRNLAQCCLDEHKFDEAMELYEQALQIDREDFGPKHRHVATDLIGMGKTCRTRSRFDEAHRYFDEALAVYNAISPAPNREKALIWRHKGRAHIDAQDYDEAVRCLSTALSVTRQAEGDGAPVMGPDYFYLGRALARLDRMPEAEQALRTALKLHQLKPYMDNDTLNALCTRLGKVLRDQGKIEQAIALFEHTMNQDRARYGNMHDLIGADAYNLGNLCIAASEYETALDYLNTALEVYQHTRGAEDARTQRVRQRIESIENLV